MIVFVPQKRIWHRHLDSLVYWASGDYPDSGINLVGVEDGRVYLSVDFGDDYNGFVEIFRHDLLPYREPIFFEDDKSAQDFAIACIKQVHPELAERNLNEFFSNDDRPSKAAPV
jgi:hypothetical protein